MTEFKPRTADDLAVGETVALGPYLVERDEMLAFSNQWDPQAFHIDEQVATASRFGQLIASGAYTIAVFQRLSVLSAYEHWAIIAGRRMTDIEFLSPVVPGQQLAGTLEIVDLVHVSDNRSMVTVAGTLKAGEVTVMTLRLETFVARG